MRLRGRMVGRSEVGGREVGREEKVGLVRTMLGRSEGGCREVCREDKCEINREDSIREAVERFVGKFVWWLVGDW